MKYTLISILSLLLVITTGCKSRITITQMQESTMSPEAVDNLKRLRVVRIPIIRVSDKRLIKIREAYSQSEAIEFEEMQHRFASEVTDTFIHNIRICIITPPNILPENKDKAIFYVHGGGFFMGKAADRTSILMATEMGLKTYSVDYSLSPENKFPVAMNECLEAYKQLIQKYDPDKLAGISISAGCNHMLAMLVKAREQNLPMMSSIALLSAASDISGNGDSWVFNDGRDILAAKNQSEKLCAYPFVGDSTLTHPLVSPIYSKYDSTFPPTSIVTGTRDLFLSNSIRLYWKLREAGVKTELLVMEGMWHSFTNYPDIPEAIKARKATQSFLFGELNRGK